MLIASALERLIRAGVPGLPSPGLAALAVIVPIPAPDARPRADARTRHARRLQDLRSEGVPR